MKKLLAILAIVVLATTFTFADTWTPAPATGSFTGTVYCIPQIDGPGPSVGLGNFFTGTTPISVTGSLTWNLYGPKTPAVYSITVTDPSNAGIADDGATSAILHGTWTVYTNTAIQASSMTCPGGSATAFGITYNASTVTPGIVEGSKKWTLTVTASASI